MASPAIKFGTDGWRAVVADDFTYENVRAVAQGVAWYVGDDERPLLVGHDARYCAELFAREVARVLVANGRKVVLLDRVTPTPAVSWTVITHKAAGAVVVTASHNSAEFNGIKYKPDFGGSAPPEVVAEIERHAARALAEGVRQMPYEEALSGGRLTVEDPLPAYLEQLAKMVDLERLRSRGLRILHEAMYGAGAGLIARALHGGATTVEELHAERNPGFGGMHPEPIDRYMPDAMQRMGAGGFDLGIANDGDADRVGIIDETGRYVNQLQVMALFTMYLLEKREQRGDIVRSLTESAMVDALGERFGVTVHEMPVGFKYIGTKMQETNAILGGEESGGFAFHGHIPERDGILAGLMMADMLVEYGQPLSQILAHLEELVGPHAYDRHDIKFPREGYDERKAEIYKRMKEQTPAEIAGTRVARVRDDDGFKFFLDDGSWVLMRMSGTEPLMRVYSEAASPQRVGELIAALEQLSGVEARQPAAARH
ncbi:MAG: phosphoglucomutase/phosphomannomutase family protein [Candidatus Dormibacteraeota bacterium]|nr:phosphoglucomutase/phosphomannomutase family protein [Candidatus Dormibacteraeota bacterium]MBV9525661.1 phosphoglucomutase/phosphomannomutase family protein [Candidatus Dormibacteraeota bacterium]